MDFLRSIILKNLSLVTYLVLIFFFLYSIYILRYYVDGHHVGLMYSNSIDLIHGKLPYKEIFIQYGILTTLIHALILIIFDQKIFFLSLVNSFLYFFTVFLICKTIENITNKKLAFLGLILILFNHPIPWLPWSNYLAYFFISISLFILTKKKPNFFLKGFFLSLAVLCRQDFFISVIFTFSFYLLFFLLYKKKNQIKFSNVFFGFFIPLILFYLYLNYLGILNEWLMYFELPNYYLDIYKTSIFKLIFNYIIFFISDSFFKFIIYPQYFLISVILIVNSVILFLKIIDKIEIDLKILFISILSIFLSITSLQIELFRSYTSVIIGIIPLISLIHNIKNINYRKNCILIVLLPAFFSIVFYPMGNNELFKKIDFKAKTADIIDKNYQYYKWPDKIVNSINTLSDISKKCPVDYLSNLTFNSLYSTIGNYKRIRLLPFEKNSIKDSNFHLYIDSIKNGDTDFVDLINRQIENKNIIILIKDNNNLYKHNNIIFTNNYKVLEINESNIIGKPNVLRIYLPDICV